MSKGPRNNWAIVEARTWNYFNWEAQLFTNKCCTHSCEETLFNLLSPPLIQGLAIVAKTRFNVFWFWGPKNTGPNPDHPFESNPQGRPQYRGSLTLNPYCAFSGGPMFGGGRGRGPQFKVSPSLFLFFQPDSSSLAATPEYPTSHHSLGA